MQTPLILIHQNIYRDDFSYLILFDQSRQNYYLPVSTNISITEGSKIFITNEDFIFTPFLNGFLLLPKTYYADNEYTKNSSSLINTIPILKKTENEYFIEVTQVISSIYESIQTDNLLFKYFIEFHAENDTSIGDYYKCHVWLNNIGVFLIEKKHIDTTSLTFNLDISPFKLLFESSSKKIFEPKIKRDFWNTDYADLNNESEERVTFLLIDRKSKINGFIYNQTEIKKGDTFEYIDETLVLLDNNRKMTITSTRKIEKPYTESNYRYFKRHGNSDGLENSDNRWNID